MTSHGSLLALAWLTFVNDRSACRALDRAGRIRNRRSSAVQSAILESPSRRLDITFWRRTIDRLKSIEGTDRQLVELEDARLRMSGPLSDSEIASLIGALQKLAATPPEDTAAHRLLAEAYLRSSATDHLSRAATEMQRAHELRPADFETTAELVQILVAPRASSPVPERLSIRSFMKIT